CHRPSCRVDAHAPATLRSLSPPATAPTEIHTLSLHDALPIYLEAGPGLPGVVDDQKVQLFRRQLLSRVGNHVVGLEGEADDHRRSEEHTSELQSRENLVCRLLLEKKKQTTTTGPCH